MSGDMMNEILNNISTAMNGVTTAVKKFNDEHIEVQEQLDKASTQKKEYDKLLQEYKELQEKYNKLVNSIKTEDIQDNVWWYISKYLTSELNLDNKVDIQWVQKKTNIPIPLILDIVENPTMSIECYKRSEKVVKWLETENKWKNTDN